MNTSFIKNMPIPVCVVGTDGTIVKANSLMKDVILYENIVGAKFFTLTGIKRDQLVTANEEELLVERNEKCFQLRVNDDADSKKDIIVFFEDRTAREEFEAKLENERATMVLINIDNYDELLASAPEEQKRVLPSQIDSIIRKWGAKYESPIMSTDDDRYFMVTTYEKSQQMIEDNFCVLEEVRNIDTDVDFPISISIGLGISENGMNEANDLADAALDLALGRGGDQVVIKDDEHTRYYGGSSQTVEKSNRGKARVIAHAVKTLINESDKVIIMGHKWPDMDAFGAAIGAYSICKYLDKDAAIVIEEHSDAINTIYQAAVDSEEYEILKHERAMYLASRAKNPLLIVVDVNRPQLMECPELLDICKNVVLIDHHRRTEDSVQNTAVAYVESYASSASELVSEIIQHIAQKKFISRFEGEALLAGIMVDTNNFSGRSGVRTFEAAAWLRRAGADSTEVKRYFQTEKDDFQAKASALAKAEFREDGIVFGKTKGGGVNATIINAQVADELLMVKGVDASFAIGRNEKGQTIISARSLGEINVQLLMEKFGGGGHFTSAAAQIDDGYDVVRTRLEQVIDEYLGKDKLPDEDK